MATRIQNRRGTATEWSSANPTLSAGELGFEIDTNKAKIGDGSTSWNNLQYLTGSGGGGGKNYIARSDFESNSTTGWILRNSTLSSVKLPNQSSANWTAAAATLAYTTVSSGQLSGKYSLSLSSTGATTAGNMLLSDEITLDLEAQASVQSWSFFYKVVSGAATANFSGTSSNSVGVAIYVVDGALAGTWIQPAGVYNVVQTSGVGKASGTFQVPSDATKVRLAVYFPNATTGSLTLYLDDFYLGPQVVQYGAPVTDWQSYTPTYSGLGTVTGSALYYRRMGDSIQIVGKFTTGTVAATTPSLTLPAGLSIDTSKITSTIVGRAQRGLLATGSGEFYNSIIVDTANPTQLFFSTANNGLTEGSKITNGTSAFGNAESQLVSHCTVPILGWSSSVQMSSDTDTRVIAAKAFSVNSATSANSPINFASVEIDTNGSVTTGAAWRFTAQTPGVYEVSSYIRSSATVNGTVFLYKNGSVHTTLSRSTDYLAYGMSGTTLVALVAGDYIDIRCDAAITTINSPNQSSVSIKRLSGPSVIAASESASCSYSSSAGNSITAGTPTLIVFGTREHDTHGIYSTSTGLVTIPVAGRWRISALITSNGTSLTTAQSFELHIYKNGTLYRHLFGAIGTGASTTWRAGGTTTLTLQAGDTIAIYAQSPNASTLFPNAAYNHFSCERIGN